MNKKLLTAVVGTALATCSTLASAELTVYGRVNTDMEHQSQQGVTGKGWVLKGDSSRFGIRNIEDIGGGVKSLIGFEFEVSSDSDKSLATGFDDYRNIYVGLSSGVGTFLLGRFDSASPAGSPMYTPITTGISYVNQDSGTTNISKATFMNVENRLNNSIGYRTPGFGGGFEALVRYSQLGPEDVAVSNTSPTQGTPVLEGHIKELAYGLNYRDGPLYASVAGATKSEAGGLAANAFKSKMQMLASYHFGFVKLFGFIAQDKYETPTAGRRSSSNYYVANAMFPVGKWEFIATYLNRQVQANDTASNWVRQLGVGYNLSTLTRLYAFYDVRDPNNKAPNDQVTAIGAGVRVNF